MEALEALQQACERIEAEKHAAAESPAAQWRAGGASLRKRVMATTTPNQSAEKPAEVSSHEANTSIIDAADGALVIPGAEFAVEARSTVREAYARFKVCERTELLTVYSSAPCMSGVW